MSDVKKPETGGKTVKKPGWYILPGEREKKGVSLGHVLLAFVVTMIIAFLCLTYLGQRPASVIIDARESMGVRVPAKVSSAGQAPKPATTIVTQSPVAMIPPKPKKAKPVKVVTDVVTNDTATAVTQTATMSGPSTTITATQKVEVDVPRVAQEVVVQSPPVYELVPRPPAPAEGEIEPLTVEPPAKVMTPNDRVYVVQKSDGRKTTITVGPGGVTILKSPPPQ